MQRSLKIPAILSAALTISCQTSKPVLKVYVGDHESASIVRFQAGEIISCTDPSFSKMMCMEHIDFYKLVDLAEKCDGL